MRGNDVYRGLREFERPIGGATTSASVEKKEVKEIKLHRETPGNCAAYDDVVAPHNDDR